MLPISTQLWLIISPIFGKDSEQKSTRNPIHQGARDHSHRQVVFGQALLSHETNGEDVGVAATLRPQNGGIPRIPWTSHPFPCKMGSKMHRSNSVDTNPRFRLGVFNIGKGLEHQPSWDMMGRSSSGNPKDHQLEWKDGPYLQGI